jgi:hypothetical protein
MKRWSAMNKLTENNSSRFRLPSAVLVLIITGFALGRMHAGDTADPRPVAVVAMEKWLHEIDQGQFDQSWKEASDSFQKAVTADKWTAALNSARTRLGKCKSRTLASSMHQTEVPSPTGPQRGDFVVAQFDASFENLAYAVETVCFEKGPDGTWKASGYYVKPK